MLVHTLPPHLQTTVTAATDIGDMSHLQAISQVSWRQCCCGLAQLPCTHASDSVQVTGTRRCEWTLTYNLTLFFPALSHCCSLRADCNIHGDFKWFLGFKYKSTSLAIFESRQLRVISLCVNPHCLLVCAVTGCNSTLYRSSPVLYTHTVCCCTTAKQRYVVWPWSCTRRHSTKTLMVCCYVGCGVSPMSVVWCLCLGHCLCLVVAYVCGMLLMSVVVAYVCSCCLFLWHVTHVWLPVVCHLCVWLLPMSVVCRLCLIVAYVACCLYLAWRLCLVCCLCMWLSPMSVVIAYVCRVSPMSVVIAYVCSMSSMSVGIAYVCRVSPMSVVVAYVCGCHLCRWHVAYVWCVTYVCGCSLCLWLSPISVACRLCLIVACVVCRLCL